AITLADVQGSEDEPRSGIVRIEFDLTVHSSSRVTLALNERTGQRPAEYLFLASAPAAQSAAIEVTITDVEAGDYLVRATIDGAESLLETDFDPASPTYEQYVGPVLTVP
ncbi:MAG: DUF4255 domain-containing protein, partial [Cyanobacteria bacterium P01_H01_bin.153]